MIRIRTITYNMPKRITDNTFRLIETSSKRFLNGQFEVHTQRLSCVPAGYLDLALAAELSGFCSVSGIRWFNIPLDLWKGEKVTNNEIRDLLLNHKNAFVNLICAKDSKVKESILDFTGRQFLLNGQSDEEGLMNFRFGATMNVSPYGPFFPFTFSGGDFSFSIGLEMAEELNDIFADKSLNLHQIEGLIVSTLEPQITEIENIANAFACELGLPFKGIDFSLAPLPTENNSVISILNALGVYDINDTGAMFATAFLTHILKDFGRRHKSVGFSGVMYSLIEDQLYAEANSRHRFSIDRMISLSTMCGCGCDMVPIPLDTELNAILTVLMEIACVSSRLSKPLGVRLLPVRSNDGFTHFTGEDDFCINTRIVKLNSNSILPINGEYSFA